MDATSPRETIVLRVSRLVDRPVRWASGVVGDYDGRDRTLEIFEADASEQRPLLRLLRPIRDEIHAAAGGPTAIIFHTRAESQRLYGEFLRTWHQALPVERTGS